MLEIINNNNRESLNTIRNILIEELGERFSDIAKKCEEIEKEIKA